MNSAVTIPGQRVLIWTPKGRDAELAAELLSRAGIATLVCATVTELTERISDLGGCAIVTEEVLAPAARSIVEQALSRQPAWSDFPFIVFSPHGIPIEQMNDAVRYLGNTTIQDRPVKARTLLSAVHAALRARRRQYQARAAIEQRDQFLAMLGHELRNPLAAISLASQMLDRVAGEVGKKHRAIIERQAHHLSRLVDDLLDVSRITSGKVVLKPSLLELNELLSRLTQPAEHGKAMQFHGTPMPLHVNGDPVRVEQVFTNLLNNAVKYTPHDGHISVSLTADDGMAEVVVEDDGFGIAPDMLSHIFELFTQVPSSIDRSQGGMGIGLTLVKRLCELHGGSVAARSRGLGQGSAFTVRLPLAAGSAATVAPSQPFSVPAGLQVVLVEDNDDIRETSRELLESLGCKVNVGSDGATGLAALVEHRPQLALVDIGLAIFDGYTVARRARQVLGNHTLLVALTGYGQLDDRQRALDAGFDEHLTKPVSAGDLQRVLARAGALG